MPEMDRLDLEDELDQLRRWKEEALIVLSDWEEVWERLGRPGRLGESKAKGVLSVVDWLLSHD